MAESKTLTLTKSKTANVNGERRVTFIASTNSEDRDYEHVEISTFRLPLKGGGHILVNQLPAEGSAEVDIPLLTDHDLYSVDKVIGSVRRAFWDGTNLIFEAGISSRDYAQDVFKLLDEGHLDNAFSIQYRDYERRGNSDYDGEIVEVSLVTRGANQDAHVLAVKGLKEEPVAEETTNKPTFEETPIAEAEKPEVVETPETPAEAEETAEEPKAEEPEAEETAEEPAEDSDAEIVNITKDNTMDNADAVAKTLAMPEATQKSVSVNSTDYLKSKAALKDFAKTMYKYAKTGNAVDMWKENLASKGISGDAILPSRLENIFFETWEDKDGILATFRKISNRHVAANAFYGAQAEDIRAKGHKKGETKAEQAVVNKRRDLSVKVIYKMLSLDWQDIVDDEDGELVAFRTRELAKRVANEIALGAILGDGRSEPGQDEADYRVFDGSRGLFSIKADLDGSSVSNSYASFVARTIDNVPTDTIYAKVLKTLAKVKSVTPGAKKVVIVPEGTIADLQLIQNENGGYLFQPGTDFGTVFGATIYELAEMADSGYDVIAYADQGYLLAGTDDVVRTGFDIKTNKDQMLVERAVAGSLDGSNVAAGYKSASVSA